MGEGMGNGAKGQSAGSASQQGWDPGLSTQDSMKTGGTDAYLGQQWDPSQWNTNLGLGYFGVPAGQQQGFAQGANAANLGNGAKGQSDSGVKAYDPHPLAVLASHMANWMQQGGGSESDSGEAGTSPGESAGGGENTGSGLGDAEGESDPGASGTVGEGGDSTANAGGSW